LVGSWLRFGLWFGFAPALLHAAESHLADEGLQLDGGFGFDDASGRGKKLLVGPRCKGNVFVTDQTEVLIEAMVSAGTFTPDRMRIPTMAL
jgi:hypothetical protein